ncbi:MAG TPA: lectin-like protein [Kofleriaceae bacterium]|nr:lectin-like protein [Kofleriaceae bacterium]
MTRRWSLLLIATVACARGGAGTPDATTSDARPADADACVKQTYYRDMDGDGHGDPASPVEACEPPAGTVAVGDDCDDNNRERNPGLPEICDALDNDCNSATIEQCPATCSARRAPPDNARAYLFCNTSTSWGNARTLCANAGYKLVQIESAAEDAFVRNTATAVLGSVAIHIGGTDVATESVWAWEGSGDLFWQGGPAPGGVPVNGRYTNWEGGEPNDDGTEDCLEMRTSGRWNDIPCGESLRFVCRK